MFPIISVHRIIFWHQAPKKNPSISSCDFQFRTEEVSNRTTPFIVIGLGSRSAPRERERERDQAIDPTWYSCDESSTFSSAAGVTPSMFTVSSILSGMHAFDLRFGNPSIIDAQIGRFVKDDRLLPSCCAFVERSLLLIFVKELWSCLGSLRFDSSESQWGAKIDFGCWCGEARLLFQDQVAMNYLLHFRKHRNACKLRFEFAMKSDLVVRCCLPFDALSCRTPTKDWMQLTVSKSDRQERLSWEARSNPSCWKLVGNKVSLARATPPSPQQQQTQDFCNHLCVVPRPKGLVGTAIQNVLLDRYPPFWGVLPRWILDFFTTVVERVFFFMACFDSQSFQQLFPLNFLFY